MRSKLALTCSRVACRPSRRVTSAHSSSTRPRWLKMRRSSHMPLLASKSARRLITGMAPAEFMSTFMASALFAGGCDLDAARADEHDVASGRGHAGKGRSTHAGDVAEGRTVVCAEAHVA